MFALAAAIVAVLALFGVWTTAQMLWLWLALVALHFAYSIPLPGLPRRRQQEQQ
jgi:hypothetical protein